MGDADPKADEQPLLNLQHMEQALVRARLQHPEPMLPKEYQRLRYILRLAALDRFLPAAATAAGRRTECEVDPAIIAPLREKVLQVMDSPLNGNLRPRERLVEAAVALRELEAPLRDARRRLLSTHAQQFGAADLDAELAQRKLVMIMGGGGGAGFVYIGALARLQAAGISPAYIVGSSIGALLGAFVARDATPDYPALLNFAKGLDAAGIFGPPRVLAGHSMPGLLRLHLGAMAGEFRLADGAPMRIGDLAIPYEAVVGGIRARVYDRIPALLRTPRSHGRQKRLGEQIAERMWQLTTLITPNLIDEIVLGREPATREFEAVEAIGFSAAIPGVLQFDPLTRSERMTELLAALAAERQLAAIVDGGVANNVPAKIAWRGVRAGRIGTRSAYYLAFDSLRPQVDSSHLWLWPMTQAVQLQLPANRPYFDWLLQFQPTLSPLNLLPTPAELDKAHGWGWQQMDDLMPMISKSMEPIPSGTVV